MDTKMCLQGPGRWAPPKCVWAPPNTSWTGKWAVRKKEEASNTFVLPPISTHCWLNVFHDDGGNGGVEDDDGGSGGVEDDDAVGGSNEEDDTMVLVVKMMVMIIDEEEDGVDNFL